MEEEICFPQERKQRKPRQFFCPQSHICMVSWQGSPSHSLYLAIHDLTYHSQLFYSERESEVMLLALPACRLVLHFGRLRHDAWPCISLQQESVARLSNQRLCLCLWCRTWGKQCRSMFSIKSLRLELFLGWIKGHELRQKWKFSQCLLTLPVLLYFFCRTKKETFSRVSKLHFSIQWKWMGIKSCLAPKEDHK